MTTNITLNTKLTSDNTTYIVTHILKNNKIKVKPIASVFEKAGFPTITITADPNWKNYILSYVPADKRIIAGYWKSGNKYFYEQE